MFNIVAFLIFSVLLNCNVVEMDITEIRSKSLGRSFPQRTVRPVPKLWLQNWHHKITTKDYILNCELHFTQSYYYYKLKNIFLWICSKVHDVNIMMLMMMMTISVYYYYNGCTNVWMSRVKNKSFGWAANRNQPQHRLKFIVTITH